MADLEISRCCVCYGTYNRTDRAPISMPCGHTFCHGCIRHMTNEILFSCGICRTISPVGWAPTKKNVILIQALEKMNLLATDDTKEELDSSPLGETVDEGLIREVPTKDILSYGMRSIQVLTCHMQSRHDDHELEDARLFVEAAIDVDGDDEYFAYASDGSEADVEESVSVIGDLNDIDVFVNLNNDDDEYFRYFSGDSEDDDGAVEMSAADDNVSSIGNSDANGREDDVEVINLTMDDDDGDSDVDMSDVNDVVSADLSESNRYPHDVEFIDLTMDDDVAPRVDASVNTEDNAGGNNYIERVNAPTEAAPVVQQNGFFIPPPFLPSNYENFVAMYDQHTNQNVFPTFAVNGLSVQAPAPPLPSFNASYYYPYIGIAVPPYMYYHH